MVVTATEGTEIVHDTVKDTDGDVALAIYNVDAGDNRIFNKQTTSQNRKHILLQQANKPFHFPTCSLSSLFQSLFLPHWPSMPWRYQHLPTPTDLKSSNGVPATRARLVMSVIVATMRQMATVKDIQLSLARMQSLELRCEYLNLFAVLTRIHRISGHNFNLPEQRIVAEVIWQWRHYWLIIVMRHTWYQESKRSGLQGLTTGVSCWLKLSCP